MKKTALLGNGGTVDVSKSEQGSANSKKGGGKFVLAICIGVIVILVAVIITLLLKKGNEDDNSVKRNVVVNPENVEEIVQQMDDSEKTEQGYYEVTMNFNWRFEDGSAPSENAYVKNSEANANSVYFDVTLADTEETIYESPIIPVGSYLEDITLGTDMEAGTYDCVATYHLLDDENVSISTVRVSLTIDIAQ